VTEKWTLAEWQEHVANLSDEELWIQATAANRMEFYRVLRADGYTGAEIETVIGFFADRFRALGKDPPPGGLFDLSKPF
jgi:hypothetical protein